MQETPALSLAWELRPHKLQGNEAHARQTDPVHPRARGLRQEKPRNGKPARCS